jgi:hypothetical protein
VVLMLLAVIWVAVLAPPLLRRGAESRRSDSVGDFRRHLGVLQRTGPRLIPPAHTRVDGYAPPSLGASPQRPSLARAGAGSQTTSRRPTRMTPAPSAHAQRARTLRRRRSVLTGLVASTFLLLVLGALPSLHVVLAGAALAGLCLVAYVALLVRMRNLAAERDMKLTFLPASGRSAGRPEAALVLRRSASN